MVFGDVRMTIEEDSTTIAIKLVTKQKLDGLKVHPNQSYDEVINVVVDKVTKK